MLLGFDNLAKYIEPLLLDIVRVSEESVLSLHCVDLYHMIKALRLLTLSYLNGLGLSSPLIGAIAICLH